jgi:hypothetical protein
MSSSVQRFTSSLIIALIFFSNSYGQKVKVVGHVFYGGVSYTYYEADYLRQTIKTSSIPAYGIQSSVRYALSESFRVASGLNYVITKGTTDPVMVGRGLPNSNTTGNFRLDVNSSLLQIPLELNVTLSQKWKVKPFLAGGINLYLPLKEFYFAQINPTDPTPFYPKVENRIDQGSEYRGFFIGLGADIPVSEKKDLEIRVNYRANSFFYKSPVLGTGIVESSRKMNFNILELSIGVSIF